MARSRYLRPDFFDDTVLARCSHSVRLLYVALWTLSDRVGVFEWDSARIKKYAFGYDPITPQDVEVMLADLLREGRIKRAEYEGKTWGYVVKLVEHQHFHKDEKPRFTHVARGVGWIETPCEHGANTVQPPSETGASRPDNGELRTENGELRTELRGNPAAKEYRGTRQQEHLASGMWQERERKLGLPAGPLDEDDMRRLGRIIRTANAVRVEIGAVFDEWFRPEWRETFGVGLAQLDKRIRDVLNAMADTKLRPKLRNDPPRGPAQPKVPARYTVDLAAETRALMADGGGNDTPAA